MRRKSPAVSLGLLFIATVPLLIMLITTAVAFVMPDPTGFTTSWAFTIGLVIAWAVALVLSSLGLLLYLVVG